METSGSIRVACASNSADCLDGHFGNCTQFLIYQVSTQGATLIETRKVNDLDADDKSDYRAALISDCDIVYLCDIGGPAAAKVIKTGVFPVKQPAQTAAGVMEQLRTRLADKPAPWLVKIMHERQQDCTVN